MLHDEGGRLVATIGEHAYSVCEQKESSMIRWRTPLPANLVPARPSIARADHSSSPPI